MRYYNRAIELHPSNSDAFVARGAAQANNGQLKEAAADFRHALRVDPGSRNAAGYLEAVMKSLSQQQGLGGLDVTTEPVPGHQKDASKLVDGPLREAGSELPSRPPSNAQQSNSHHARTTQGMYCQNFLFSFAMILEEKNYTYSNYYDVHRFSIPFF